MFSLSSVDPERAFRAANFTRFIQLNKMFVRDDKAHMTVELIQVLNTNLFYRGG